MTEAPATDLVRLPPEAAAQPPDDDLKLGYLTLKDIRRFCTKVDVPSDVDPHACWPWTAGTARFGYGSFWSRAHGSSVGAHTVAAYLAYGPPPSDKPFTLHSCDNPVCCNPIHLRYGTAADNARDRDERGRHPRGEQHTPSKLTEADVRAIRAAYVEGARLADLGRRYSVTPENIASIVNHRTWKAVK